ncbi:uncharacterized protein LOC111695828 [Eurytemora carolleeae]|uniref:uncharacterized protein LOC111695828 n=1 Tax=Eurytemora carolleeae TaxID=1294199 RepID=UPI000C78557C|nr:uncharacterized protein LOC111695828 [Eurytemora carolleeae]|eukprot:XP_023321048.1 uncharacterized protein LOC111695828 [Eurytemora affinis]
MDFLVPYQTNNICRGLENCSVCEQIKGFDDIVHQNLTEEYFNQKYSRTLRPVVVRNIALDWPVIQNLDFDWVRDIYLRYTPRYQNMRRRLLWIRTIVLFCMYKIHGEDCMFTSYKYYQFRNFHSVFRLTTSKMYFGDTGRSWYISWVVCQETVLRELVKLIKVPAFISQNNSLVNYTNSLAPTLEPSNQHNPISTLEPSNQHNPISTDQPSDSTTTNSNITDSAENKTSVEKPNMRLFIGYLTECVL